jgi:pyridoxal phosphate enzyme (YggS family)
MVSIDTTAADSEAIASHVAANLADVESRVAAATASAGRPPSSVTLVAVSKAHPAALAGAALAAGHRVFGENRVQEAAAKWPALRRRYPGLELHLIGPLQTNKVKQAVALFDVIETVDRIRLAVALAREIARAQRRIECFVEVNTGAEAQKSGVMPEDTDGFVALCRDAYGLHVTGLMCIPPLGRDPAPHFAQLAEIARRNRLAKLSMGMTADFEAAIRHGATHVRIGTAIFGERSADRAHR